MPLSLLLIPFALFLLFFVVFALASLGHLFVFGEKNFTTFLATFIFIAGTLLIANTTWNSLSGIHWTDTIDFFQIITSFFPF